MKLLTCVYCLLMAEEASKNAITRTYRNYSNINFSSEPPAFEKRETENYRAHSKVGNLMKDQTNADMAAEPNQKYRYTNKYI